MLETCPRCDYLLRGLPAEHACPECGLRYDARSETWRKPKPKPVFLGLIGFGYAGFWVVRVVLQVTSSSPFHRSAMLVATGLFLGGLVWFASYLVRLYLRGRMVAAIRDGVYLRLDRPAANLIPLSNISRAAVKPARGAAGAVIFLLKEQTALDVVGVFKDHREAERFVEIVNEYIRFGEARVDGY